MPAQPGVPALLRQMNDRTALEFILDSGPLTRAELAERTGLSRVTASQSLARLEEFGLVEVIDQRVGGRGPRADVYGIRGTVGVAVGADLRSRSAHVQVAVPDGRVVVRHEEPRASDDAAAAIEHAVRAALAEAGRGSADVLALVVAAPGLVDPSTKELRFAFDLAAEAGGFRAALAERLQTLVLLENDVNLAAVAEQEHGAAQGTDNFVLVWLGRGIGLALVIGGEVYRGQHGAAGEIGYLPVSGARLPDQVDHVSQGGFQRLVGREAVQSLAVQHGVVLDSSGVAAVGAEGSVAVDAFTRALARQVSLGVAAVCTVVDPDLVVLSGSTAMDVGPALPRYVAEQARRVAPISPDVVLSALGPDGPLRGATVRAVSEAARLLAERVATH